MSDISQENVGHSKDDGEVIVHFDSKSVGARLARTRAERGWTVQYVAEQLKLSQSQIVALEADQFEKLPKLVIVRGFVRAYAKLLRIDATELMQLMPHDTDTVALETSLRPALATPFIEPRASLTGHAENNKRYVVGILILLVLVAIILTVQRTDLGQQAIAWFSGSGQAAVSTDAVQAGAQVQSPVASSSAIELPSLTNSMAASNTTESVSASQSSAIADNASAPVESIRSASSPATAGGDQVIQSTSSAPSEVPQSTEKQDSPATGSNKLVLRFKHDSWLFVKANGGVVLVSKMVRAGAVETFDVKQGLFVKIGNALEVEATLRGSPLQIVTERDSKVASLSVK